MCLRNEIYVFEIFFWIDDIRFCYDYVVELEVLIKEDFLVICFVKIYLI